MHAREAAAARGRSYVGVQLVCLTRALPEPGDDAEDLPWVPEVLWAGPVQTAGEATR